MIRSDRENRSLVALLVTVIVLSVLVIIFNLMKGEKRDYRLSATVSNAKQLATGFVMYTTDHDDKPPFVHPFEFGLDPLRVYGARQELHRIYTYSLADFKKSGTDYRFQFVLNKETTKDKVPVRLVLGPISALEEPSQTIILTGNAYNNTGQRVLIAGFADSHIKRSDQIQLALIRPPTCDIQSSTSKREKLLFVTQNNPRVPKFWEVPYEDIEQYASWAKKQSAAIATSSDPLLPLPVLKPH